jgi:hypothetical protein
MKKSSKVKDIMKKVRGEIKLLEELERLINKKMGGKTLTKNIKNEIREMKEERKYFLKSLVKAMTIKRDNEND